MEPSPGVNQLKDVHTVTKVSGPRVALGEAFDPHALHSLEKVTAPYKNQFSCSLMAVGQGQSVVLPWSKVLG